MLPAHNPPHPSAVKRWLEELKRQSSQADASGSASPASFGMDPNTGKLLAREALSQDSTGGARENDLLGTPLFCTPAAGPRKLTVRSRLGITPQSAARSGSQQDSKVRRLWTLFGGDVGERSRTLDVSDAGNRATIDLSEVRRA